MAPAGGAQERRSGSIRLRRSAKQSIRRLGATPEGAGNDGPQQADCRRDRRCRQSRARRRFEGIDVLCNLAGAFRMGEAVHETADATWDLLFDANVRSLRNMVRAVVPVMLDGGGGRIVNVGAYSARTGVANMGAYTAAKTVVLRLTEAMAAELRDRNINVNCVLPGTLDTPDNRAAMPAADPARFVSLSDLAEVIVFLASPAAHAIHGAA